MCVYICIYRRLPCRMSRVLEATRMWQVAPDCRLVVDFPSKALNTGLRHVFA